MLKPSRSAAVLARLTSEWSGLLFKRRIVIRAEAAEVQSMFKPRRIPQIAEVTTSVLFTA
jgi:hypothetical protein